MNSFFICPKCKEQLFKEGNSLKCKANHCYDISKEGYVNLHLTNKKSELIGDNKEMIISRRDFLATKSYEPLALKVSELVNKYAKENSVVLDCGCGSGYYTHIIKNNLKTKAHVLGIDISKEGIKIASKLSKDVDFAIASAFDLPLKDNSVDILVSIFAPYAIEEMKRVLKKGGIAIFVNPNKLHLWELKEAIYGEKTYEKDFTVSFKDFREIDQIELLYNFTLKNQLEIDNLITMTPYCYKTPKKLLENAKKVQNKPIKAHFDIRILQNLY